MQALERVIEVFHVVEVVTALPLVKSSRKLIVTRRMRGKVIGIVEQVVRLLDPATVIALSHIITYTPLDTTALFTEGVDTMVTGEVALREEKAQGT